MQPVAFAAEQLFGSLNRGFERVDAGRERRKVVQRLRELAPRSLADLAGRKLIDRNARERAKRIDVEVIQRDADDAAARDEPDAREVEEAGQEFPAREIAGGSKEHDDLRKFRANPGRDFFQAAHPPQFMPNTPMRTDGRLSTNVTSVVVTTYQYLEQAAPDALQTAT